MWHFDSKKGREVTEKSEILLPIIVAWPKSKEQYLEEFEKASHKIAEVEKADTGPVDECGVLLARK